jgi:hypothetical protein
VDRRHCSDRNHSNAFSTAFSGSLRLLEGPSIILRIATVYKYWLYAHILETGSVRFVLSRIGPICPLDKRDVERANGSRNQACREDLLCQK